ncbi:hypothetical protein LXL04_008646 [Taraxacum kok-saghyz]
MLGLWKMAAKDLHVASNLDFDEYIRTILKKVQPSAHKIVEHRRKYDKLWKKREKRKNLTPIFKAIRYTPSVVGVVPTWRRVKGVHTTPEGRGRGETVFRTTD